MLSPLPLHSSMSFMRSLHGLTVKIVQLTHNFDRLCVMTWFRDCYSSVFKLISNSASNRVNWMWLAVWHFFGISGFVFFLSFFSLRSIYFSITRWPKLIDNDWHFIEEMIIIIIEQRNHSSKSLICWCFTAFRDLVYRVFTRTNWNDSKDNFSNGRAVHVEELFFFSKFNGEDYLNKTYWTSDKKPLFGVQWTFSFYVSIFGVKYQSRNMFVWQNHMTKDCETMNPFTSANNWKITQLLQTTRSTNLNWDAFESQNFRYCYKLLQWNASNKRYTHMSSNHKWSSPHAWSQFWESK